MGNALSALLRRLQRGRLAPAPPPPPPAATPAGNPVPPVVHRVVRRGELRPGRLVVVGDVHGCLDELQALLDRVGFRRGAQGDNLFLVGDLVNKGPRSAEVVAAVRGWAAEGGCWAVRGNHDDAALAAHGYISRGGEQLASVKPKFLWAGGMSQEDVDFLQGLPFTLRIEGTRIAVVHAGLVPGVPLEHQELVTLTKMRDVLQQPEGGWVGLEKPREGSMPWAQCWQGPEHVFFGHDAKRRLQDCPAATGLDTGCVYGGELTACVLPPLPNLEQLLGPQEQQPVQANPAQQQRQHLRGGNGDAPPSLRELGGQLVSVAAGAVHEQHKGAKQPPSSPPAPLPDAAGDGRDRAAAP